MVTKQETMRLVAKNPNLTQNPCLTLVNALLRERPRKYLVEDSWVAEGS
jgi:hypothetical protein